MLSLGLGRLYVLRRDLPGAADRAVTVPRQLHSLEIELRC